MNTFLLLIIAIPIVEIYLFIKIGSQIGAFNTILLIFITAFFSYRDQLFMSAYEELISNWRVLNYGIGGMGIISKTVEIDTIDLLLNYGILGFFVYIYVFLKNILGYMNRNLLYLFIPVVANILLRGNFLYYPSVIYVSILIFVLINKNFKNATLS